MLYCGRHDYGSRVLRTTGNLEAVMKTMGHKDVKTVMQYQHPELEMVREAIQPERRGSIFFRKLFIAEVVQCLENMNSASC